MEATALRIKNIEAAIKALPDIKVSTRPPKTPISTGESVISTQISEDAERPKNIVFIAEECFEDCTKKPTYGLYQYNYEGRVLRTQIPDFKKAQDACGDSDQACSKVRIADIRESIKDLTATDYVGLLRGKYTAPELNMKEKRYISGEFHGDIQLFDLKTGKHLGGFPVAAGNRGTLNYSYAAGDQERKARERLHEDLRSHVQVSLGLNLQLHVTPTPDIFETYKLRLKKYTGKGLNFSVDMPFDKDPEVEAKTETVPLESGPTTFESRSVTGRGGSFFEVRRASWTSNDSSALVEQIAKHAQTMYGKDSQRSELEGPHGKGVRLVADTSFDDQLVTIETRIYPAGAQAFWLTSVIPAGMEGEAKRFFDSFKITATTKVVEFETFSPEGTGISIALPGKPKEKVVERESHTQTLYTTSNQQAGITVTLSIVKQKNPIEDTNQRINSTIEAFTKGHTMVSPPTDRKIGDVVTREASYLYKTGDKATPTLRTILVSASSTQVVSVLIAHFPKRPAKISRASRERVLRSLKIQ